MVLKPLTAAPGNDQHPGSQEYVLRRGGDGTRWESTTSVLALRTWLA